VKVFISHSSRADPFAGEVREAVCGGLQGHQVFVDMVVLRPGDEWRAVLYEWLAECHAAVVLVNREALSSAWVKREVSILLWRRALGVPLTIVPVIIGDLRTQDLRDAGLGDLPGLLQAARLTPGQGDAGVQALVTEVVGRLADTEQYALDKSPMAAWVEAVAYALGQVVGLDKLVSAAQELGVAAEDQGQVRDSVAGPRFLALQMLGRWQSSRLPAAMGKIADFMPTEWVGRLCDHVAATWVDGEAARGLLEFDTARPGTVVLNARYESTARHYVDRATCRAATGFAVATVTDVTGEEFLAEFETECANAVAQLLGADSPSEVEELLLPDRTLRPTLDGRRHDVLFLVVHPGKIQPELLVRGVRAVHSRYPWLVVVLLTGQELPTEEELAGWQLADARRLQPALAPLEELTARQAISRLRLVSTRVGARMVIGAA
jgi:TIR domain-containing protein